MNLKPINFSITDSVAVLQLNRPEAYNSLNIDTSIELLDLVLKCETDSSIKSVVITGSGKAFCAGGDVKSMGEALKQGNSPYFFKKLLVYLHSSVSSIVRMNKPVIAAVNGITAGAGMSLMFCCDMAVAAESAKFSMSYTNVGLTPDLSSTYFLPRVVGIRKALELTLLNNVLTAKEALDAGIINFVYEDEKFQESVFELAQRLANGPVNCYGMTKRLFNASFANTLDEQLAAEAEAISSASVNPEAIEGITAFNEKRKPVFK